MNSVNATGTLEDGFRVRVSTGKHEYVLDTPEPLGGSDQGALPGQVLLAALVGCQAMTARLWFRKQRLELRDLSVETALNMPNEGSVEGASFTVKHMVDADLSEEQADSLLAFLAQKCDVGVLLQQTNPVETTVELA